MKGTVTGTEGTAWDELDLASALMELISQFVRQRKWKINWKPSDNNSARFSVLSEKPIDNATLTKMPARFLCFYNLTNWL